MPEQLFNPTSGYSLDGESLPDDVLDPYIQQAIDQINFVIGDSTVNKYGASNVF
jgi:alpha-N-arabinofuranosidase